MDFVTVLAVFISAGIVAIVSSLFLLSWLTVWPVRTRKDFVSKYFVYDPSGVGTTQFPNVLEESTSTQFELTSPSLYLSVVIPSMNEEERLPVMLSDCLPYLMGRAKKDKWFTFEVIIVDDGSTDRTADIGFGYTQKYGDDVVRVLKLQRNQGKGGAVRTGVLRSRGAMILFADADGATRFADFERVENELLRSTTGDDSLPNIIADFDWTFPSVAVGSRAHMEAESMAKRSLARTILMIGFHILVFLLTVRTVRDTQCGFKLFTRAAAARLFSIIHIERWAFDVELLYLAERFCFPIREVAVSWHEVDGSKIVPVWSWIQMGRDLLLIWFRYLSGIWKAEVPV